MSRTRRTSRLLITATAIVFTLGLSFWGIKFSRHSKPKTAASPSTQPAAAPILAAAISAPTGAPAPATQPVPAGAPEPQPLVMTTPGLVGSSTQPATVRLALNTQSPKVSAAAFTSAINSPGTPTTPAPMPTVSAQPLVDAKAKLDASQLLEARRILNAALATGKLSAADTAGAKQMLNTINAQVVFSKRPFPEDEFAVIYTVKSGDRLQKIAAEHEVTSDLICRINGISDPRKVRAGQSIKILQGPVCAVVSKSGFTIELYLNSPGDKGSVYLTSFPVGLGKDDSTPKGTWMVEPHNKIKKPTYYSPRGEGVIAADDPANPLGGYWIGLTGIEGHALDKKSYGIHGTIHPESIGKMESMGCIRLKNEDIGQVFDLLVEGKSLVVVKE